MDTSKNPEEINAIVTSNASISLELGDIIEIISPANDLIHESTMYIKYIDNQLIQLTSVSTLKEYQLNINENGELTDESIIQINLLSRSDSNGYARQNNLLPNTWINIHIGGEVPTILTGEITNLEEDMIEIVTYPELKYIYIDFKYQGIPLNIPIEKIMIREKPASLKNIGSLALIKDELEEGEEIQVPDEELANIQFTDSGESIINIPENTELDKNIHDTLEELYLDANQFSFDEDLGEIKQAIERPANEQRHGIDIQVNDMMDELLSTIPTRDRTDKVMNNIHNLIEKYKQLREHFSKFDNNQNIYASSKVEPSYKPLIQHIMKMDIKLQWLLPVIKLRRKIYDDNSVAITDIITEESSSSINEIKDLQNIANENNYTLMQKRIDEIMIPFENEDNCIYNTQVMTNLEAIVDNLEDFNSTVISNARISKRKYVIQRYNLGLTRLEGQDLKSGKTVYTRTNITDNESLCLKSLITLPIPAIRFSTIQLPSTSILDRANAHQNYLLLFRVLRSNTDITPHVISELEKELDYEKMENETKQNLLDGMHEFILDDNDIVDNNKFEKFLECFIPQTRNLIRIFRKYMKNKLSVKSVVQQLEPFMINIGDITYGQFKEIRFFIKEQITNLKTDMEKKAIELDKMSNNKFNVIKKQNVILRLLADNKNIADTFFHHYGITDKDINLTNLTANELLQRIISADTGNLFMNGITKLLISLMTPDNLLSVLNEPIIDEMSSADKIKSNDCNTRYLSKRYSSIKELQKDNNVVDLYFDKDLDNTPYSIMEKYKEEQNKMEPIHFLDFLTENLIQKHEYSKHLAKELASTLINKQKLVEDGNYAVVEIKPSLKEGIDESKLTDDDKEKIANEAEIRKKIQYFKRLKNNWIPDNEIQETAFIDTRDLFCNISENCSYNNKDKICASNSETKIRIKNNLKDSMINEFDKRYQRSVEELQKELEDKLELNVKMLKRNNMLREVQEYRANNLAYTIGTTVNKNEQIVSPHITHYDLIMGQPDFSKKQKNICDFVNEKCREPMVKELNESPNWYYCKDTNTKLFPMSLFKLANAFVSGDDYGRKLDQVCAEYGILSDNGDAIVCKYSGEELRKIDFVNEDGFDEAGFRIVSHDIIENDLGDMVMNKDKNEKQIIFENELSEVIYNIAYTITRNINIPIKTISPFILRISNEIITKYIMNESAYQIKVDELTKKTDKKMIPYEQYRNETIIIIVSAVTLISIQTIIPSFNTNKTFPGCVKSFNGYPLSGIEDLSSIEYLACVLHKSKSSIKPWDSIKKLNTDKLATRIKDAIDKYIINRNDIQELYTLKRKYIILNPDKIIPNEHNINNWHHFMPPIKPISVTKSLSSVSGDFKNELIETIKKGNMKQNDLIALLNGRISLFGYGLIEIINTIIKKENLLLKTSSQLPFLENACCDSIDLIKPIQYFNNKDANIQVIIKKVKNMIKLQNYIKNITKTPSFYHKENTRLIQPDITHRDTEENIYAAIIYYCNFDKKLPIPSDLTNICQSKPDDYNSSWSILEKLEFMKRNGKRYDVDSLNNLMTIVNNRNIITNDPEHTVDIVNGLSNFIEYLDTNDSTIFDTRLREHLRLVINQYNPKQLHDTQSVELENLTNYLYECNQNLYNKIMQYFHKNGNLADKDYNNLATFLSNIKEWSIDKNNENTENMYDNGLYTVVKYLYDATIMISKVLPTYLLNNKDFFDYVPKHWDLDKFHIKDIQNIIAKFYNNIEKFKDDKSLINILQDVEISLTDMRLFLDNIPVQTDIRKQIIDENGNNKIISFHSLFGKETLYLLFTYCFYLTLNRYIDISDEPNIINNDVQQIKLNRRNEIQDNNNTSNLLEAVTTQPDESVLTEVNIYTDTVNADLKTRVASLLYQLLQMQMNNKTNINYSYEEIIKKVNLAKEREKQSFVDYFESMTIDNRKAEKLMKKYKLGRWNIGTQKGVTQYDKQTYVRERDELIAQVTDDIKNSANNNINEIRREVYDIELQEEEYVTNEEDNEFNNIQGLDEDYQDGIVYEEDRDMDF